MKLFEIPMVVTSLVGLGFLAGVDAPLARADITFGEPVDLQSTLPFLNPANDEISCFSADGLEMYLTSTRGGGQGGYDLWVCKRASPEDDWGAPENLGPVVNSAQDDLKASLTGDGLELYFYSNRAGWKIYVTKRATRDSPWGPPTLLGPSVNSSSVITCDPSVTADGLELYFTYWPGAYGQGDFYVSHRATTQDPWGPAADLGPAVNSQNNERWVCVSADGLVLFYYCNGGDGGYDIWMTKRAGRSAPWEPAVNLGPKINGPLGDFLMCLAPDGSALYFNRVPANSSTPTSFLKAPILPIVDFNGDGKVDEKDMAMLVNDWGMGNWMSACDIGPYAWGDGVVDEKDLKVFMEAVVKPAPKASDVPCDASLSWVAAPTAKSDVYLGTSMDAVTSASRANPQGVLVSQGQTGTSYGPATPLDFNRTYYWRIDQVIGTGNPTIYPGPVLSFTTVGVSDQEHHRHGFQFAAQHGSGEDDRRLRAGQEGWALDDRDGHVAQHRGTAQLDSVPVRPSVRRTGAVGVELESGRGAFPRLRG